MYLTKMLINPARRGARKLLTSPQAMHAAVMLAFPETPKHDGHGPRVLWRLDTTDGPRAALYVSSPAPPDLTHIVEQAGWPTSSGWQTHSSEKFLASLDVGQRWIFRLTANPAHSVPVEGRKRGQRLGHVTPAQQEKWLLDRMDRHGFRITRTGPSEDSPHDLVLRNRANRAFKRENATVQLTTATYDGTLEVTDADALRGVLTIGLGSAKGYGCGLMTLAPAR